MIFKILLVAHIAFGMTSFIAGTIAAISQKGSPRHRSSGKVFAISLMSGGILAIAMCAIKPNAFLLGIDFFTIYLISSGWLWVRRIKQEQKQKISKYIGIFGVGSAAFMYFTAFTDTGGINIVLLVFASILMGMSLFDLFKTPGRDKNINLHGGRMGGAFIAAVTAFVVTNIHANLPPLLLWLGPGVIGTILITLSLRQWNLKQSRPKAQ